MEKNTIIYGPAGSGKTRLAEDIAHDNNTLWLDGRHYFKSKSKYKLQYLTVDTELIVIDDILRKDIYKAMWQFSERTILFNIPGTPRLQEIKKPKIILTCGVWEYQFPTGVSITERFDFIKLESIDDYFKEREKLFGRSGKSLIKTAISHINKANQP